MKTHYRVYQTRCLHWRSYVYLIFDTTSSVRYCDECVQLLTCHHTEQVPGAVQVTVASCMKLASCLASSPVHSSMSMYQCESIVLHESNNSSWNVISELILLPHVAPWQNMSDEQGGVQSPRGFPVFWRGWKSIWLTPAFWCTQTIMTLGLDSSGKWRLFSTCSSVGKMKTKIQVLSKKFITELTAVSSLVRSLDADWYRCVIGEVYNAQIESLSRLLSSLHHSLVSELQASDKWSLLSEFIEFVCVKSELACKVK